MNNLKAIREKAKVTQEDISNYLGVSLKTYRKYEKSGDIPSGVCIKLSEYYSEKFNHRVSIDYLMGMSDLPWFTATLEGISEMTHISEKSISNIVDEGLWGDSRNVAMLDLLLSDKETFNIIMNNLVSLTLNNYLYIPKMIVKKLGARFMDDGALYLEAPIIRVITDTFNPDNMYRNIRNQIEKFVGGIEKDSISIAPNEYHYNVTVKPWLDLKEEIEQEQASKEKSDPNEEVHDG